MQFVINRAIINESSSIHADRFSECIPQMLNIQGEMTPVKDFEGPKTELCDIL